MLAPSALAQMCTTAQTRAARSGTIDAITGASARRITTMWFTIAVLVALSAALIIDKARAAGRGAQGNLGCMSAQWIAEHRSSRQS